MLVLGRKTDESVMIGDEIIVTVLAVEGDRIKLGIQAPPHVRILRQELYESVKEENLRAAGAPGSDWLPSLRTLFEKKDEPPKGRGDR
jgi:carbon storage regulator